MYRKRVYMILFSIVCLVLTGCSSNESDVKNNENNKVEVTLEKEIDGDTIQSFFKI
nr:hypothetical protein [Bacillus sp. B1-b2]